MKGISEEQLLAYASFGEDEYTDFASYRDCTIFAREIIRLRRMLARKKRKQY